MEALLKTLIAQALLKAVLASIRAATWANLRGVVAARAAGKLECIDTFEGVDLKLAWAAVEASLAFIVVGKEQFLSSDDQACPPH